MSYSPVTGLVYLPIMQMPLLFGQPPSFEYVLGQFNLGTTYRFNEDKSVTAPRQWGALIAWDPLQKKAIWRVAQPEMWNGGALSTAGALVFSGNAHGEFSAYEARTGKKLWEFKQPAAVMAGPVSFSVDGVQYVVVLAGAGGAGPLALKDLHRPQQRASVGRVLAFSLEGNATLPSDDLSLPPANPPQQRATSESRRLGESLFFAHCMVCHGGSVLPDLRRSAVLTAPCAWQRIVIEGIDSSKGMVSFARWLSASEAESIRQFVGEQARDLAQLDSNIKSVTDSMQGHPSPSAEKIKIDRAYVPDSPQILA